jgi:transposase
MVVVDGQGIPLGSHIDSATPAEVTLVDKALDNIRVHNGRKGRPKTRPKRLVGDKGYDSDPLRESLGKRGIRLISPYRKNRKNKKVFKQATRERYRRRYKVERTFAWIGSFRRLTVRYDHSLTIYRAFFHLACIIIVLRRL